MTKILLIAITFVVSFLVILGSYASRGTTAAQTQILQQAAEPPIDLVLATSLILDKSIGTPRLADIFRQRGVSFKVTDALIEGLRTKGASQERLKVLHDAPYKEDMVTEELRKKENAEKERLHKEDAERRRIDAEREEARKKLGVLDITCEPAECMVTAGDGGDLTTTKGKLTIPGLKPGPLNVKFSREKYNEETQQAIIVAASTVKMSVSLKPGLAARRAFGKALLDAAAAFLGGSDALTDADGIEARGEVVTHEKGKQTETRQVRVVLLPDSIKIEISQGKKFVSGLTLGARPADKGPVPPLLRAVLPIFRDLQIAKVILAGGSRGTEVLADRPLAGGAAQTTFELSNSIETITIAIGKDALPVSVTRKLNGIGTTAEVRFHDFKELKPRTQYPWRYVIKPDASSEEGVEFKFTSVEAIKKSLKGGFPIR